MTSDSQVFFVPLPARPLLRAARDLLTAHNCPPRLNRIDVGEEGNASSSWANPS